MLKPKHIQLIEEAHRLDRENRRDEAITLYERFLKVQPGEAGAWSDYGGLLMLMGRLEEAQKACFRALRLDSAHLGAMIGLGCISTQKGRLTEAEGYFRRVLGRDSSRLDARLALAECLIKKGAHERARYELGRVIEQEPANETAHQALGEVLHREGSWPEYFKEIERFQSIDSSSKYVKYEQGFLGLLFGEMPHAWDGYEARFQVPGLVSPVRSFDQPRWGGEPFEGKTLLLHYEQGYGDTIMFIRYAKQAKALGGRVILAAQRALAELVSHCAGLDEVIPHGDPLPSFDLQLPLLSLPFVFQTKLDTVPAEVPYVVVPENAPNRLPITECLETNKDRTRIGVLWAGNPIHKNDQARSIPPEALSALGIIPGVKWFSFQLGANEAPDLPGLTPLAPFISDFSDTAVALEGMDLVITADTALAHLAGALALPTFLLLPFSPDWRWMLNREDSPWYPTMRIYRQPEPGNWVAVVEQILMDLRGD